MTRQANIFDRAARAGGWSGRILSLLAGILIALGQAPFDLWPLAVVGLILAALRISRAESPATGFWRGFTVGFGFAAVALIWIVEPFLVDAARHGFLAPFALAAMSAGFGLFWGLGFWLAVRLTRPAGLSRAFALAAAWTLMELARAYLFTGFPWALVSLLWLQTPVYQLAAFVGPHGLAFVTLCLAAVTAGALVQHRRDILLTATACLAIAWGGGWMLGHDGIGEQPPEGPIVRLIQPNAPQHLKWDPDWRDIFFELQLSLSAGPGDPDLLIWPEVAVTFRLDAADAPFERISNAAGSVPVIFGGQRVEGGQAYNSMLVLDESGAPIARYDKHHLVPFGEYAPGGGLAAAIGLRGLAEQLEFGFAAGPGPRIINLGPNMRILPMICYEAIFPHELRSVAPERPDWLLHLTNDAWFGDFSGPYQHLAQARARAIEFGLPVVRVANTGISAVIAPNGKLLAALPLGEHGALDARIPPPAKATFYWQTGDIIAFALVLLTLIAIALLRSRDSD